MAASHGDAFLVAIRAGTMSGRGLNSGHEAQHARWIARWRAEEKS